MLDSDFTRTFFFRKFTRKKGNSKWILTFFIACIFELYWYSCMWFNITGSSVANSTCETTLEGACSVAEHLENKFQRFYRMYYLQYILFIYCGVFCPIHGLLKRWNLETSITPMNSQARSHVTCSSMRSTQRPLLRNDSINTFQQQRQSFLCGSQIWFLLETSQIRKGNWNGKGCHKFERHNFTCSG
jgi:hypothetical protein